MICTTGLEADECRSNPECSDADLNGVGTHPLDSFPIVIMTFLWPCGTYQAWKLWTHPTSAKVSMNSIHQFGPSLCIQSITLSLILVRHPSLWVYFGPVLG